jgi:hypothetical protein
MWNPSNVSVHSSDPSKGQSMFGKKKKNFFNNYYYLGVRFEKK